LPIYPLLTREMVSYVCDKFLGLLEAQR